MIFLHIYYSYSKINKSSQRILIANLSRYLNKKKEEIKLKYNKNGKPEVEGINFSISHSKQMMIQAFTVNGKIGVDIEYINNKRKYLQLAQRYFHSCEYKYLLSLDEKTRIKFFYDLWTAKEAVCKAQGGRLWYYLSENYLSLNHKNGIMAKLIKGLQLQQFETIKEYSVSMATEYQSEQVKIIHEY